MAFFNSYKALKEYDNSLHERAAMWKNARSIEDLRLAEYRDVLALRKVQSAFAEDVNQLNTVADNIKDVSIMFIRDCVKRFHGYEGPSHEQEQENKLRQGFSLAR